MGPGADELWVTVMGLSSRALRAVTAWRHEAERLGTLFAAQAPMDLVYVSGRAGRDAIAQEVGLDVGRRGKADNWTTEMCAIRVDTKDWPQTAAASVGWGYATLIFARPPSDGADALPDLPGDCIRFTARGYARWILMCQEPLTGTAHPVVRLLRDRGIRTFTVPIMPFRWAVGDVPAQDPVASVNIVASSRAGRDAEAHRELLALVTGARAMGEPDLDDNDVVWTAGRRDLLVDHCRRVRIAACVSAAWARRTATGSALKEVRVYAVARQVQPTPPQVVPVPPDEEPGGGLNPLRAPDLVAGLDTGGEFERLRREVVLRKLPGFNDHVARTARAGQADMYVAAMGPGLPGRDGNPGQRAGALVQIRPVANANKARLHITDLEGTALLDVQIPVSAAEEPDCGGVRMLELIAIQEVCGGLAALRCHEIRVAIEAFCRRHHGYFSADGGPVDVVRQLGRLLGEVVGTAMCLTRLLSAQETSWKGCLHEVIGTLWRAVDRAGKLAGVPSPGYVDRFIGAVALVRALHDEDFRDPTLDYRWVRLVGAARDDVVEAFTSLGLGRSPPILEVNGLPDWDLARDILLGTWAHFERWGGEELQLWGMFTAQAWSTMLRLCTAFEGGPQQHGRLADRLVQPRDQLFARMLIAEDPNYAYLAARASDTEEPERERAAAALDSYIGALLAVEPGFDGQTEAERKSAVRWERGNTCLPGRNPVTGERLPDILAAGEDAERALARAEGELSANAKGIRRREAVFRCLPVPEEEAFGRMGDTGYERAGCELLTVWDARPDLHAEYGATWFPPVLHGAQRPEKPMRFPDVLRSWVFGGREPGQVLGPTELLRRMELELCAVERLVAHAQSMPQHAGRRAGLLSFNISPELLDPVRNPWCGWFRSQVGSMFSTLVRCAFEHGFDPTMEIVEGDVPRRQSEEDSFFDWLARSAGETPAWIAVDDQFGRGTDVRRMFELAERTERAGFPPLVVKIDHTAVASLLPQPPWLTNVDLTERYEAALRVLLRMTVLSAGETPLRGVVFEGYLGDRTWPHGIKQRHRKAFVDALGRLAAEPGNGGLELFVQGPAPADS